MVGDCKKMIKVEGNYRQLTKGNQFKIEEFSGSEKREVGINGRKLEIRIRF